MRAHIQYESIRGLNMLESVTSGSTVQTPGCNSCISILSWLLDPYLSISSRKRFSLFLVSTATSRTLVPTSRSLSFSCRWWVRRQRGRRTLRGVSETYRQGKYTLVVIRVKEGARTLSPRRDRPGSGVRSTSLRGEMYMIRGDVMDSSLGTCTMQR